jgi:hypothetical protein
LNFAPASVHQWLQVEHESIDRPYAHDQQGGWAALTRDLHIRTRPHERAALDCACIVFFFLAGAWESFSVEETVARLIRLIPKMAAQTEIAERGRFELPINPGSKLRPHRK